ncbi:unnamed protein product, partial [Brassica oleracea var. botrytis]
MEDSPRMSKSVGSFVLVKDLLVNLLRYEVCNGQHALFWFDLFSDLGPLLTFVGDYGPRLLRVRLFATVANATRNGGWNLSLAKLPQIEILQIAMTAISPHDNSLGNDKFMWIQSNSTFGPSFSSKVTWELMKDHKPLQPWSKTIWFK